MYKLFIMYIVVRLTQISGSISKKPFIDVVNTNELKSLSRFYVIEHIMDFETFDLAVKFARTIK